MSGKTEFVIIFELVLCEIVPKWLTKWGEAGAYTTHVEIRGDRRRGEVLLQRGDQ